MFSRRDDQKFLSWELSAETLPDGLEIRFGCRRPKGCYPAEEYPKFHDSADAALGALEQTFVIH